MKEFMNSYKWITYPTALFLILLFIALLVRGIFFTFIDNYEFGYKFDAQTGELYPLKNKDGSLRQGYIFAWPIVNRLHTIDMRPQQICINANSRVLNCKLVQFNPDGFETFVAWHGRESYSNMKLENILKSYAYDPSNKSYPFLDVLKELKNEDYTEVKDSLQTNQPVTPNDSLSRR